MLLMMSVVAKEGMMLDKIMAQIDAQPRQLLQAAFRPANHKK